MTREGARAPRRRSTKTAMKRKVDERGREMTSEEMMSGRRRGGGGEVAEQGREEGNVSSSLRDVKEGRSSPTCFCQNGEKRLVNVVVREGLFPMKLLLPLWRWRIVQVEQDRAKERKGRRGEGQAVWRHLRVDR